MKGENMLESSILSVELIKKILQENYGLTVKNVERINRGSANIFDIDHQYILKEFSSDREVSSIEKEYQVIKYLTQNGFRVPTYIETLDGKAYVVFQERILILQKYLEGYAMENNTGDYDKTIESATLLGKLTKCLEGYSLNSTYQDFPTKESLEVGIQKMREFLPKIKADNPHRDQFIADIERKIEISQKFLDFPFEELKKVTLKLCHGDYSVQQLIYHEELGTAIIDFETVRKMPIDWEIIRSYSYVDKECANGEFQLNTFLDYVREVQKYIDLTEYDLKYMPYIYLFQLVPSTFGYKQYNDDYNKKSLLDFALFRTNVCNYLYDHLELLSNELLKLLK